MKTLGQLIYGENAARHTNDGKSFRQAMADAGEREADGHADTRERLAARRADLEGRLAGERADGDVQQARKAARIYAGTIGHRIAYDPATRCIILRKRSYPVAGARAEVNDFRSGLAGRKHTTDLTVTLASGEVLAWHETDTGVLARVKHNEVVKFAAVVNTAAAQD